jgi:hypothetical protein
MIRAQPQNLKTTTTGPTTAKLKNKKPVNKQLQLQDLNFAKLNQTRTRRMEQTNEQASTTEPMMSAGNNFAQFHCKQHHQKIWNESVQ